MENEAFRAAESKAGKGVCVLYSKKYSKLLHIP